MHKKKKKKKKKKRKTSTAKGGPRPGNILEWLKKRRRETRSLDRPKQDLEPKGNKLESGLKKAQKRNILSFQGEKENMQKSMEVGRGGEKVRSNLSNTWYAPKIKIPKWGREEDLPEI